MALNTTCQDSINEDEDICMSFSWGSHFGQWRGSVEGTLKFFLCSDTPNG